MRQEDVLYICVISALLFLTLAVIFAPHIFISIASSSDKNSVVYYFQSRGTIGDNVSSPPPRAPIEVDFIRLIPVLVGLFTIMGWISGLFEWLWWRAKYGKSRTPVVMPIASHD